MEPRPVGHGDRTRRRGASADEVGLYAGFGGSRREAGGGGEVAAALAGRLPILGSGGLLTSHARRFGG